MGIQREVERSAWLCRLHSVPQNPYRGLWRAQHWGMNRFVLISAVVIIGTPIVIKQGRVFFFNIKCFNHTEEHIHFELRRDRIDGSTKQPRIIGKKINCAHSLVNSMPRFTWSVHAVGDGRTRNVEHWGERIRPVNLSLLVCWENPFHVIVHTLIKHEIN